MSVMKYIIQKTGSGFTTVPNKVIQNLNNAAALGVYIYMQSLPQSWEFYKSQLREHFGIGIHKINSILKLLEAHNLIKIIQIRNEKGRFDRADIEVNDGTDFIESPCYKNRNTVTVLRQSAPIKEIQINEKRKTKRASDSVDNSTSTENGTVKQGSSLCLKTIQEDFHPDEEGMIKLYDKASRLNMGAKELLDKFVDVSRRYKTRSSNWQKTFVEFIDREKPRRVYEDSTGKRQRYDGQSMYC